MYDSSRLYRALIIFLAALLYLSYPAFSQIKPASNVIDSDLELSKDPQWLALLHFERNGPSKIQPGNFFLSPDGHKDPKAELAATLAALRDPVSETHCLFPARHLWLSSKLPGIGRLNKTDCDKLATWYDAIKADGLTLILASSFVNNPASAFGHTFLRLDQKNSSDLLAYSANFAAETNGENALSYAAKGIFGGYNGYFSVMPYYQKVKEYSDLENRDIWEYQLALNPDEIKLLTLHLYELRNIPASYYYFDENCSYKMLELLMVARPSLRLSDKFDTWVLPVDSVRAVNSLTTSVKFRPSAGTNLRNRISHADINQRKTALKLSDEKSTFDLSNVDSETLDLAYELIIYKKISGALPENIADERAFKILTARGERPESDSVPITATPLIRPEQAHESAQFAIEEGRKSNLWFTRMIVRPAFHDLLDPQAGHQPGSQINFFESAFDYTEKEGINIGYFTALDITSLTPQEEFFSPLSWSVTTGLKRNIIQDRDDSLTSFLAASFGQSYSTTTEQSLVYSMIDSEIRVNRHYQHELNPGTGLRIGALQNYDNRIKINLEIQWLRFVDQTALNSKLGIAYSMTPATNIVARISNQREYDRSSTVGTLGFEWYFTPG